MAKGKYQEWLEPDKLILIEGWARDGLTDEQIAKKMGISRSTLTEWAKKYSVISDTLKRGKETVDRMVENALLKRALGYEYTEVTKERIIDTGQKKRHGGESELTQKEWDFAIKYFNCHCCYCGSYMTKPTKDHIRPLIDGGALSRENVIPCCKSCNSSKKDREMLSWYQEQYFFREDRLQRIYDYMDFVASLGSFLNEQTGDLIVTKEVTKQVAPDVTAGIFWLKNRMKEEWREKRVVDDNAVNSVKAVIQNMQTIAEILQNPVNNRNIDDLEEERK